MGNNKSTSFGQSNICSSRSLIPRVELPCLPKFYPVTQPLIPWIDRGLYFTVRLLSYSPQSSLMWGISKCVVARVHIFNGNFCQIFRWEIWIMVSFMKAYLQYLDTRNSRRMGRCASNLSVSVPTAVEAQLHFMLKVCFISAPTCLGMANRWADRYARQSIFVTLAGASPIAMNTRCKPPLQYLHHFMATLCYASWIIL